MEIMKKCLLFLLSAMFMQIAAAQENGRDYEPYPYTFVGLAGGAQVTFSNNSFNNLVTPIGAVSVGRFFSPVIGTRLNVQGFKSKAGYKDINRDDVMSDFKYITTDIDLLVNLSNIISPKRVHPLNVILVAGLGVGYTWDREGKAEYLSSFKTWRDNCFVYNLRAGVQLEYNVTKHIGVNLELAANNMPDRFNMKSSNSSDWQATALLGVAYKFGFKKKRESDTGSALAGMDYNDARNAGSLAKSDMVVADEKKPKPEVVKPVVEKVKPLREEVFFDINSSKVKEQYKPAVKNIADWMKQHPEAKVVLTGYADAGTGTKAINRAISEKRANSISEILTGQYGIAKERISIDFKGDSEQPFKENDKNRVVIGTSLGDNDK